MNAVVGGPTPQPTLQWCEAVVASCEALAAHMKSLIDEKSKVASEVQQLVRQKEAIQVELRSMVEQPGAAPDASFGEAFCDAVRKGAAKKLSAKSKPAPLQLAVPASAEVPRADSGPTTPAPSATSLPTASVSSVQTCEVDTQVDVTSSLIEQVRMDLDESNGRLKAMADVLRRVSDHVGGPSPEPTMEWCEAVASACCSRLGSLRSSNETLQLEACKLASEKVRLESELRRIVERQSPENMSFTASRAAMVLPQSLLESAVSSPVAVLDKELPSQNASVSIQSRAVLREDAIRPSTPAPSQMLGSGGLPVFVPCAAAAPVNATGSLSLVEEVKKQLDACNARVRKLAGMLERVNSLVGGPLPEPTLEWCEAVVASCENLSSSVSRMRNEKDAISLELEKLSAQKDTIQAELRAIVERRSPENASFGESFCAAPRSLLKRRLSTKAKPATLLPVAENEGEVVSPAPKLEEPFVPTAPEEPAAPTLPPTPLPSQGELPISACSSTDETAALLDQVRHDLQASNERVKELADILQKVNELVEGPTPEPTSEWCEAVVESCRGLVTSIASQREERETLNKELSKLSQQKQTIETELRAIVERQSPESFSGSIMLEASLNTTNPRVASRQRRLTTKAKPARLSEQGDPSLRFVAPAHATNGAVPEAAGHDSITPEMRATRPPTAVEGAFAPSVTPATDVEQSSNAHEEIETQDSEVGTSHHTPFDETVSMLQQVRQELEESSKKTALMSSLLERINKLFDGPAMQATMEWGQSFIAVCEKASAELTQSRAEKEKTRVELERVATQKAAIEVELRAMVGDRESPQDVLSLASTASALELGPRMARQRRLSTKAKPPTLRAAEQTNPQLQIAPPLHAGAEEAPSDDVPRATTEPVIPCGHDSITPEMRHARPPEAMLGAPSTPPAGRSSSGTQDGASRNDGGSAGESVHSPVEEVMVLLHQVKHELEHSNQRLREMSDIMVRISCTVGGPFREPTTEWCEAVAVACERLAKTSSERKAAAEKEARERITIEAQLRELLSRKCAEPEPSAESPAPVSGDTPVDQKVAKSPCDTSAALVDNVRSRLDDAAKAEAQLRELVSQKEAEASKSRKLIEELRVEAQNTAKCMEMLVSTFRQVGVLVGVPLSCDVPSQQWLSDVVTSVDNLTQKLANSQKARMQAEQSLLAQTHSSPQGGGSTIVSRLMSLGSLFGLRSDTLSEAFIEQLLCCCISMRASDDRHRLALERLRECICVSLGASREAADISEDSMCSIVSSMGCLLSQTRDRLQNCEASFNRIRSVVKDAFPPTGASSGAVPSEEPEVAVERLVKRLKQVEQSLAAARADNARESSEAADGEAATVGLDLIASLYQQISAAFESEDRRPLQAPSYVDMSRYVNSRFQYCIAAVRELRHCGSIVTKYLSSVGVPLDPVQSASAALQQKLVMLLEKFSGVLDRNAELERHWQKLSDMSARQALEVQQLREAQSRSVTSVRGQVDGMRMKVRQKLEADARTAELLREMESRLDGLEEEARRYTLDRQSLATRIAELRGIVRQKIIADRNSDRQLEMSM